jgi:hypothetical protein
MVIVTSWMEDSTSDSHHPEEIMGYYSLQNVVESSIWPKVMAKNTVLSLLAERMNTFADELAKTYILIDFRVIREVSGMNAISYLFIVFFSCG